MLQNLWNCSLWCNSCYFPSSFSSMFLFSMQNWSFQILLQNENNFSCKLKFPPRIRKQKSQNFHRKKFFHKYFLHFQNVAKCGENSTTLIVENIFQLQLVSVSNYTSLNFSRKKVAGKHFRPREVLLCQKLFKRSTERKAECWVKPLDMKYLSIVMHLRTTMKKIFCLARKKFSFKCLRWSHKIHDVELKFKLLTKLFLLTAHSMKALWLQWKSGRMSRT